MPLPADIQVVNINDVKRFSPEARVNQALLNPKGMITRMNCYEPGQITPAHIHPEHDEVVFCVEGRGKVAFQDRGDVPLVAGTIINLPAGLGHWIEAAPDSRMVVVYWAHSQYTSIRLHKEAGYSNIRLPGEVPPSPDGTK